MHGLRTPSPQSPMNRDRTTVITVGQAFILVDVEVKSSTGDGGRTGNRRQVGVEQPVPKRRTIERTSRLKMMKKVLPTTGVLRLACTRSPPGVFREHPGSEEIPIRPQWTGLKAGRSARAAIFIAEFKSRPIFLDTHSPEPDLAGRALLSRLFHYQVELKERTISLGGNVILLLRKHQPLSIEGAPRKLVYCFQVV